MAMCLPKLGKSLPNVKMCQHGRHYTRCNPSSIRPSGIIKVDISMTKESIIAIVLGLVLGVAVAFAVVFYTVHTQKEQNTQIQPDATGASVLVPSVVPPTVTVLRSLEITAPQSGTTAEGKTVAIRGNAGVKTLIIVQSAAKNQVLTTEQDSFSIDFPLVLGENAITVSAYHEGSVVPVQKKLYIYRLDP